MNGREHIIDTLYSVIMERKANPSDNSYTASLMQKGIDKILKKVGEESAEVIIAAKGGDRQEIICETADLLYHLLVMLGHHGIAPEEVYTELRKRFGISGIAEKNSRRP